MGVGGMSNGLKGQERFVALNVVERKREGDGS